ncbi:BRCT domain-containing protein [Cronobacter sakazakii]|uniref:BRCT domain-containing protein n=1 Tax=Cronobacter sakazakii TaxID=28141 RepID=UPI0009780E3F|nr:BRCT domain-containing protein [Cronobacter sakazakii]
MEEKQQVFNYTRNRDKLFANLISIIDGILSDGNLTDQEIIYLDTWLLEADQLIGNGIIKSLRIRIASILDDGVITAEEREELKQYLHEVQSEILDIPEIEFYSTKSDLHLLNGLCKGLISDRVLSQEEIKYLDWWLTQNGALKANYPGKELYRLVKDILSDGEITIQESEVLHKALIDFTGCDLDSGTVDGLATRLPVDDIADVKVSGKAFCLTGIFLAGKRSAIEDLIQKQGGTISSGVTKKIDYLVIGTLSSRDWRFSSHGRKIEKAVTYRDDGAQIKIITEEMLIEALP